MQELSKEFLMRVCQDDDQAFHELYIRYRIPALKFCNSILKDIDESENIIQDVFIKIWDRRRTLNPDLNFTSYLFTIIKNRVFDYLKEVKRNEAMKEAYWSNILEYKAVDNDIKEERLTQVKEAVDGLSEKVKEIVKLNYQEGKSYDEIADHLNISKNTVRNQLVKAKKIIRKQLKVASMLCF